MKKAMMAFAFVASLGLASSALADPCGMYDHDDDADTAPVHGCCGSTDPEDPPMPDAENPPENICGQAYIPDIGGIAGCIDESGVDGCLEDQDSEFGHLCITDGGLEGPATGGNDADFDACVRCGCAEPTS